VRKPGSVTDTDALSDAVHSALLNNRKVNRTRIRYYVSKRKTLLNLSKKLFLGNYLLKKNIMRMSTLIFHKFYMNIDNILHFSLSNSLGESCSLKSKMLKPNKNICCLLNQVLNSFRSSYLIQCPVF